MPPHALPAYARPIGDHSDGMVTEASIQDGILRIRQQDHVLRRERVPFPLHVTVRLPLMRRL